MNTLTKVTLPRFLNDYHVVNCQTALFLAGSNKASFLIKVLYLHKHRVCF